MKNIIGYDLWKEWKTGRITIISIFAFSLAMILLIFISYYSHHETLLEYTIFFYFASLFALIFMPIIKSIRNFDRDISGRQAVLERSLPVASWKNLLSKFIVTICILFVTSLLAVGLILILAICLKWHNVQISNSISMTIKFVIYSFPQAVKYTLKSLEAIVTLLNIVYFSIAFSKSISHKNKIAVPISIGIFFVFMFVLYIEGLSVASISIYYLKRLISILFYVIFMVSIFIGTSWLLDKKIES